MNTVAEIKHRRYLSWEEACPETSYVAATFHPTIEKCAHESLENTATPELAMIPTRNKGTTTGSHIAKDVLKSSQAKTTFGFIRLLGRWNGWIDKLVSSTTSLWKPTQDLAWISKHLHTKHKEASPSLLYCPLVYAFHSSAIQGVQRRKSSSSWSICEVPFHTSFIKLIFPQFHSKPVQTKTNDAHTAKCKFWAWTKTS